MISQHAAPHYFVPPRPYLWRWAEDASAVEWTEDGSTICLWEELHAALRYLAPGGLPPLGAILLVLMACGRRHGEVGKAARRFCSTATGAGTPSPTSSALLEESGRLLTSVAALPEDLRRGLSARALLLRTLFGDLENGVRPPVSTEIVDHAETHGVRSMLSMPSPVQGLARLLRDLKTLAAAGERIPVGETLEDRLRTGLDSARLIPLIAPELPAGSPGGPALDPDQLEDVRDQLAAVAAAARRFVAMFSLPRSAGQESPLPVGGISDITNRGDLDRLLPGELAHDDDVLSARLAGNEALYHRRDSPPEDPAAERIILVDSGIHLWGIPRVLALAGALGFKTGAAEGEPVRTYLREGPGFEPMPLENAGDILAALGRIHPEPEAATAVEGFHLEPDARRPNIIFISVPRRGPALRNALHSLSLRAAEAGGKLYELTVDRNGAAEFFARSVSGVRLIAAGRIDPDTLVRPRGSEPEERPGPLTNLPESIRHLAFYQQWPLPFRFPAKNDPFVETFGVKTSGLLVTADRRLIRLDDTGVSGLEMAAGLPAAKYRYAAGHGREYVVVSAGPSPGTPVSAMLIDRAKGTRREVVLAASHSFPSDCKFQAGAAVLGYGHKVEACSLTDGSRVAQAALNRTNSFLQTVFNGNELLFTRGDGRESVESARSSPPERPKTTEPLMEAPLAAGFTSTGALVLRGGNGGRELNVAEFRLLPSMKKLLSAPRHFAPASGGGGPAGEETKGFYIAEWHSDCRCVYDPRGVIHLLFHDMHGPVEISILCLRDQPLAAWVRHWPARYSGNSAWFADPNADSQPVVHLAPLLRRFSSAAHAVAARRGSLNPV